MTQDKIVFDVPHKSFIIGYEISNGNLAIFSGGTERPVIFIYQKSAENEKDGLNKFGTPTTSKSDWQVYKMKFERVESEEK